RHVDGANADLVAGGHPIERWLQRLDQRLAQEPVEPACLVDSGSLKVVGRVDQAKAHPLHHPTLVSRPALLEPGRVPSPGRPPSALRPSRELPSCSSWMLPVRPTTDERPM